MGGKFEEFKVAEREERARMEAKLAEVNAQKAAAIAKLEMIQNETKALDSLLTEGAFDDKPEPEPASKPESSAVRTRTRTRS